MKSKSFFGIFIVMAAVPLLLAYLVLQLGLFTPGATAKGEFLEQAITLNIKDDREDASRPMWRIVYRPNSTCDALCSEQLYGLNQTHAALGKLQKRVIANVLTEQPIDLTSYTHIELQTSVANELSSDYLYIVDPFGKAIMRYSGSLDREETIQTSKYILADLKKLLKYARVG